jgi:hypothetical protein
MSNHINPDAFARAAAFNNSGSSASSSQTGMSLRDYFAAKVLAAHSMYVENAYSMMNADHRRLLARDCYAMADAMLAERAK